MSRHLLTSEVSGMVWQKRRLRAKASILPNKEAEQREFEIVQTNGSFNFRIRINAILDTKQENVRMLQDYRPKDGRL